MSPKTLNIFLMISSVMLYNYVINPLYSGATSPLFEPDQDIKKLVEKRDTYSKTIEAFPGIVDEATTMQAQYDSIQEVDRKKILTMVPVSVNDVKLMSELTNIGVDSGVPIDGMGIKDKGGYYSVSFSVMTTYTNFKKIMTYWENSMRLFTLQSVSFSPGKTEEEEIKFTVELSTYYMK